MAAFRFRRPDLSFDGLSTGFKMLLALTAALLPLGLIALAASIQADHARRVQRASGAQVAATSEARQVDVLLLRGAGILRGMLAMQSLDARRCQRMLRRNASDFPRPIALALIGPDGMVRCATPEFDAAGGPAPRPHLGIDLALLDKRDAALRFTVAGPDGAYGVGLLPAALLHDVLPPDNGGQGIVIAQHNRRLPLATLRRESLLSRPLTLTAPVAGGQAALRLTVISNPFSAAELLLVLLPLLMWTAAAAIGWIVVDHLLLRPLAQLQRAVAAYRPAEGMLELPRISTPSGEIRALADAFAATTAELARRQSALEEGLQRQVRLTREVHHRVKNNLQVVASLINLHARGSEGDVAAAYASIQRRVDALAVVHRNHYAEMEENRGVALRSILAELSANLRATAPAEASHLAITLDMMPAHVTQDVAVPVAFLVTEIVELAMMCDPRGRIGIALKPGASPDRAILSIAAPGMATPACREHPSRERFQRIVTGLSRQLRTTLEFDGGTGQFEIVIAVFPAQADADEPAKKSPAVVE